MRIRVDRSGVLNQEIAIVAQSNAAVRERDICKLKRRTEGVEWTINVDRTNMISQRRPTRSRLNLEKNA